ncbi:MAG: hypothetical protein IT307_07660 [Chloroflexi bacterium]|nr:hypothetical protein [Chloroflexota bacterium]
MLRWSVLIISTLALAGATAFAGRPAPAEAQPAGCIFQLGFETLHDMIPDIVGDCIENEWHNAENGDGLQRTTHGLEVWRKSDNWTAFTDGYMTWVNGPFGLQARLNTERFPWEGDAAVPALPSSAPSSGAGAATGGAAGGGTTATSTPTTSDNPPDLDLHLSDDTVDQNATFQLRLTATDDDGVDAMWWWATSTSDQSLRDTHTIDCHGATPCRQTFNLSTSDTGTITFHAVARDMAGNTRDEVVDDLRVRSAAATATPTPTPVPTATPTRTP